MESGGAWMDPFKSAILKTVYYYASYAVGFLLMLILSALRCRVYRIKRSRAVIYSFFTFFSGYAGAAIIGFIYNALWSLKKITTEIKVDVIGAVIFTSLFLLAAVYIEKGYLKLEQKRLLQKGGDAPVRTVSFRDTMDLMIPGSFLVFACIKIGCTIRGCCLGVECSWGLYGYTGKTYFPIQPLEAATICLIILVCYFIKQTKFYRRGMGGPLTAFFYGLARFLWEFLRYYTPEMRHFALGLTLWQFLCLLILVVAGVWIKVLYKTQPSEPLPKEKPYVFFESKFSSKKKLHTHHKSIKKNNTKHRKKGRK